MSTPFAIQPLCSLGYDQFVLLSMHVETASPSLDLNGHLVLETCVTKVAVVHSAVQSVLENMCESVFRFTLKAEAATCSDNMCNRVCSMECNDLTGWR